jgi:3',5'-cyclic AMP phosphodiesterase CpdA
MPAKKPPFRIVQLSDLHLTASDDACRSEPKLFGKLEGMNAAFRSLVRCPRVRAADLLLVTGDVADRGDLASWKVFWEGVREAGIRKVRVIPGNHDVCCLGLRASDPKRRARDDLARAIDGMRLGGSEGLSFPWLARVDERIAIIGLNSNNMGNLSGITNAIGKLHLFQLSRVADFLYATRDVPVKIIALHHSPNIPAEEVELKRGLKPTGSMARMAHQIDEAGRLGLHLLSQAHRVRLVVHGHLHRAEVRKVGSVRIVGAPASTELMTVQGKRFFPFFEYTVSGRRPTVRTRLLLLDQAGTSVTEAPRKTR